MTDHLQRQKSKQNGASTSTSRKPPRTALNSSDYYNSESPMMQADEEEMDRKHLEKIIAALQFYRKYSYARVNKSERYLNSLSHNHQRLFIKYRKHLSDIRNCIDDNQTVINKMIRHRESIFGPYPNDTIVSPQDVRDLKNQTKNLKHQDMENVQSTLKQFARDWSIECAEEREQSYRPIINVIEEYFNPEEMELNEIKILVPGFGSGRLTYELACRGYECEGNEYSFFMLLASYFVLNTCTEENQYTIYPWVHQYVNNLQRDDQTAPVRFPDVCPVKNPPKGTNSVTAGDFLEVYKTPNIYNCVATCFFIDCANNIAEFIETIFQILVPGGIWVNLGPLLYHFSDIQGENSIEPTHEDLMEIVEAVGFLIIRSETGLRTKYAQNPRSMLKSEYESLFWVCQKPKNEIFGNDCGDDINMS